MLNVFLFFFFQAEDGIRDLTVTGVQTCASDLFTSPWLKWRSRLQSPRTPESTRLNFPARHARCWIDTIDRKSTRLNSSHSQISYAVFCLKKKKYRYSSYRKPAPSTSPARSSAL